MTRPRVLFVSMFCALGVLACDDTVDCNDRECAPTYTAHVQSADPDLDVGLWRVDLEIDGATISADCMVPGPNDGPENIPCQVGPWTTEPSRPLEVFVGVNTRIEACSGEPTDSGDPPEQSNQGIFVTIVAPDEEAPVVDLGIVVEFEGTVVLETQRSPTYEVQQDFGGPGCGSCLRSVDQVIKVP